MAPLLNLTYNFIRLQLQMFQGFYLYFLARTCKFMAGKLGRQKESVSSQIKTCIAEFKKRWGFWVFFKKFYI